MHPVYVANALLHIDNFIAYNNNSLNPPTIKYIKPN